MKRLIAAVFLLLAATAPATAGEWETGKQAGITSGWRQCALATHPGDFGVLVMKLTGEDVVIYAVVVGRPDRHAGGAKSHVLVGDELFTTHGGYFDDEPARDILAAMRGSDEVAYEWTSTPDRKVHQGVITLDGFAAALTECEAWIAKR